MAFPVPSHLPRKRDNDVSTKLLSKMSETSSKSLTYEAASAWVIELDGAIQETKVRGQAHLLNTAHPQFSLATDP